MAISFPEAKSMALDYVRKVQTKLTDDDPKTYDQFSQTLVHFRLRNIHSSTAVATVEKLFHNHPDLLHAFKPFVPSNHSAAAASEDSDLKACVDFLNRVGTRFAGDGVYRKFLDCMSSYSRGESTVSEVCDRIFRLFGKHRDLVSLFESFLPESCVLERCKKRKIDPVDQPPRKKRNRNPPKQQRIISSSEAKDFDMEESLCEVDVQIGNLTSTYMNAVKLVGRLAGGHLSPADVRLNEHFTPLNLACIRKVYRKLLDNDENPGCAMPELMNILMKKKEASEKSRVKIIEKWNKIRQSHSSHEIPCSK